MVSEIADRRIESQESVVDIHVVAVLGPIPHDMTSVNKANPSMEAGVDDQVFLDIAGYSVLSADCKLLMLFLTMMIPGPCDVVL